MPDIQQILTRGVAELIGGEEFRKKLETDPTKVVIKYGVDPTRPDIHLGHAVCLRKLRELQDIGCRVVFLVGDFTAQIGDPTGKNKLRPEVDQAAVEHNLKTYLEQAGKILLTDQAHFAWIRNSDWFVSMHDITAPDGMQLSIATSDSEMTTPPLPGNHILAKAKAWEESRMQKHKINHYSFINILSVLRKLTHAKLIERDMFQERLKAGEPIWMHEMLYPVIQGIDSNVIANIFGSCDLELGGTDQHFNMLMGRNVMEMNDKQPQAVMSLPILEGTDGVTKMSKSSDNYISINETPAEIYGKTLRIPDELIPRWAELLTTLDTASLTERAKAGENPKVLKSELAKAIIAQYHGMEAAEAAEAEFDRVHAGGGNGEPDEIPEIQMEEGTWGIVELLAQAKLTTSKSEARRLIEGGGVRVNGEKVESIEQSYTVGGESLTLQVGRRRWARIIS